MPVIVGMLCVSVFGVTNIFFTQGFIPKGIANITNTTSNDAFGTLVVHVKTAAFKAALKDEELSIQSTSTAASPKE